MSRIIFELLSENKPGVLYRVAGIFVRRQINIESLSVAETETKGISRFQIMVDISEEQAQKLAKQLSKIVEVSQVSYS